MNQIPCTVCKNVVDGYTDCRLQIEDECREGGGYECFEPKEIAETPEYTGFMPESTGKQVIVLVAWAMYFFAFGFAVHKFLPVILRWFEVIL